MAFFLCGLAAVQAVRQGSHASAVLNLTRSEGRRCLDFEGTQTFLLEEYGLKKWYDMFRQEKCFCGEGMSPSKGCGDVERGKDVDGDLGPSFQPGAADPSCKCLDPCRDFEGIASFVKLRELGVKRLERRCVCDWRPSAECGGIEKIQVQGWGASTWLAFDPRAAGPGCRCK